MATSNKVLRLSAHHCLPKISIITASYNSESTIEKCIESVIHQKHPDIEYILVDGGSTDSTMPIVRKYRESFDVIISESDNGIYDAWNKGIQNSTGEIISFLNSDDWYEPNTLNLVSQEFLSDSSLDLLYGAMNVVDGNGKYIKSIFSRENFRDHISAPFNHPATFVRKRVYDEIGLFELSYGIWSDYDFMLRFKNTPRLRYKYFDAVLTNFRSDGATSKHPCPPVSILSKIMIRNGYHIRHVIHGVILRLFWLWSARLATLIGVKGFYAKFRRLCNDSNSHSTRHGKT